MQFLPLLPIFLYRLCFIPRGTANDGHLFKRYVRLRLTVLVMCFKAEKNILVCTSYSYLILTNEFNKIHLLKSSTFLLL